MLQEFYFKKALNELYKKSIPVSINHYAGKCYALGKTYDLIFPYEMINTIGTISKNKSINFYFQGVLTAARNWVNEYKGIGVIKESYYGRNPGTKYNYDMKYYETMSASKFVLCPTNDCPWSYRFFEAIMCFAIPIVERGSPDIYRKDYYHFEHGDNYEWSQEKAEDNFRTFIKNHTLSPPLHLYYSVSSNIGDGINPHIFRRFFQSSLLNVGIMFGTSITRTESNNPCIFGIGSILGVNSFNPHADIIVGSGFISNSKSVGVPRKIISVRGPLTRDMFVTAGVSCPEIYGDLGLLFRFFYSPISTNKKYRIGFIPHYIDKTHPIIPQFREWGISIINICQAYTPQKFVNEINECEVILSSSLHGIIIADSYNIPAYHTPISNNVIGGSFKFNDYYLSVGREYMGIEIIDKTLDQIQAQLKPYTVIFNFESYYNYIKEQLAAVEEMWVTHRTIIN